jgi:hypothetical protein
VSKLGKRRAAYVVHGKRVKTIAVAGKGAAGRKTLRAYLRMVPKQGFAPRSPKVVLSRATTKLTARNAKSLVRTYEPGRHTWYCQIGL